MAIFSFGRQSSPPLIRPTHPSVELFNSTIRLPFGASQIEYIPKSKEGRLPIWDQTDPPYEPNVLISTLETKSGGGKTTLAMELYDYLHASKPSTMFQYAPPQDTKRAFLVGVIPQRLDQVKHWHVLDLVSRDNIFLPVLFETEMKIHDRLNQRLAQFSGGQTARLLVASALERMTYSSTLANYLILDEAFEGVDEERVMSSLTGIASTWKEAAGGRVLFMLVITHIDLDGLTRAIGSSARVKRLKLDKTQIKFNEDTRIETMMVEVSQHA